MLHRLRSRLTYANIVASLALFIALGGTSYAALRLPRNSVGSAQIRTSAVSSSEIKDRSVLLRDLNLGTRNALRGFRGEAGPQGAPGAPAVRYFATVTAAGRLIRGNGTDGGRGDTPGTYIV